MEFSGTRLSRPLCRHGDCWLAWRTIMPQSHSAVGHERLQVFVTLPLLPAKPLPTIELDGCRHPTDCSFPQACRLLACLFLENTIPHISQHMTRKIEISDVLGCQSHRSTVCQVAGNPARRSGADRTGCCRKIPTWRARHFTTKAQVYKEEGRRSL